MIIKSNSARFRLNAIEYYFELISAEMARDMSIPVEVAKYVILLNGFETSLQRGSALKTKEYKTLPNLKLDDKTLVQDVVCCLLKENDLS